MSFTLYVSTDGQNTHYLRIWLHLFFSERLDYQNYRKIFILFDFVSDHAPVFSGRSDRQPTGNVLQSYQFV